MKLRTIRVVPCCHWSSPYGLCLSGEGHKANKETMPCLRGCLQEVKNNVKRLFQLCFNHDIFTKPTHQNDDKLPVNGIPRARIYYTASRLPSRRSTGAPYTK